MTDHREKRLSMKKRAGTSQYALCLAAVLLLACGVLLLGTARARFLSSVSKDLELQAQPLESLRLTLLNTDAETWQMVDGSCIRTFLLEYDGTQEKSDVTVGVTLLASLGIETPEALDITLAVEEPNDTPVTEPENENVEGVDTADAADTSDTTEVPQDDTLDTAPKMEMVTYRGIAEEIPERTALWYSFGPGWCYRFCPVTSVQSAADGQAEEAEEQVGPEVTWTVKAGELWQKTITVAVRANADVRYDALLRLCADVRSEKGNE